MQELKWAAVIEPQQDQKPRVASTMESALFRIRMVFFGLRSPNNSRASTSSFMLAILAALR